MIIEQTFINQVNQSLDLYEIVSEHVALKRVGKEFVGLCPFHQERTPSFSVSQVKQLYYCFGCGEGGDAIKFVMDFNQVTFSEAVKMLAQKYSLPLPVLDPEEKEKEKQRQADRREISHALNLAHGFFQRQLQSPEAERARAYLKHRQLSKETIAYFQIGLSPTGDRLTSYLLEKGCDLQILLKAGLSKRGKDRCYDFFQNRIMFPIFTEKGDLVGFGGRGNAKSPPKYLNSPDSVLFKKQEIFYGLNFNRREICAQEQTIIVEGYFDVISLWQAGIKTAVAVLGTALSDRQLRMVSRLGDMEIFLAFDGDLAGKKATARVLDRIKSYSLQTLPCLKILPLVGAKDADEYVSNFGSERFQSLLQASESWLNWTIDNLLEGDLSSLHAYNQAFKAVAKFLFLLKDDVTRTNCLDYVAGQLVLKSEATDPSSFDRIRSNLLRAVDNAIATVPPINSVKSAEEDHIEKLLLLVYIHKPEHRPSFAFLNPADFLPSPFFSLLSFFREVESDTDNLTDVLAKILFNDPSTRKLHREIMHPTPVLSNSLDNLDAAPDFLSLALRDFFIEQKRRYLRQLQLDVSVCEPSQKESLLSSISQVHREIQQIEG